jgi:hypothetical protein
VLPILGLSVGLAATFFLAWNSEHGWPAFAPFPGMVPPTLWQLSAHVLLAISPLLLVGYGWSLVKSATRRPMEYVVAFLYAFAWPLVTLDVLSWMVLPWPHCGYGAWIAPTVMLLAHHTMDEERTPTRMVMLSRWLVVAAAAGQSCVMMQRGIDSMQTLPW